ncbi:hypothetical protein c7_L229 [Megavirus courdo7]|nr:hypothetical protein c7_L229 [Megavirus courdo7]
MIIYLNDNIYNEIKIYAKIDIIGNK